MQSVERNYQDMDCEEQPLVAGHRRRKRCFTCYTVMALLVCLAMSVSIATISYMHLEFKKIKLDRDSMSTYTSKNGKTANASLIGQSRTMAEDAANSGLFLDIGLDQRFQLQDCLGTQFKMSFPDIDYALMGYNVLRGYPLATGHDPGFTLPIFTAVYTHGLQTADCRYNIPKGLVVVRDVSCVTSFSSKVVQTSYEYAQSLSVSASVSGGGWGVSFSASTGYKESSSEIATGESVFIYSTAKCNYYFSKLVQRSPPPFSRDFLDWIFRLNITDDSDTYIEFFETYGTHFATEVKFGARFMYEHKMSSESFQKESEKGVNVAISASYSGIVSAGAGFSMDSTQKQKASEFSKLVETKTITVGAAPPANGDAMTWASTVKDNPVPSEYKLNSIEDLFTAKYINEVEIKVNADKIYQNIQTFKYVYCQHLISKGEIESCMELNPGLMLGNTRLFVHYLKIISSYKECIDHCLRRIKCSAITFCDRCNGTEYNRRGCFLYKTDSRPEIFAQYNKDWKSVIFVGKVQANLVLDNTAVVGNDRRYQIKKGEIVDSSKCQSLCVQDVHCIAYSYCTCPDIDLKCRLYSFENMLRLKEEKGTVVVFVNKHRN